MNTLNIKNGLHALKQNPPQLLSPFQLLLLFPQPNHNTSILRLLKSKIIRHCRNMKVLQHKDWSMSTDTHKLDICRPTHIKLNFAPLLMLTFLHLHDDNKKKDRERVKKLTGSKVLFKRNCLLVTSISGLRWQRYR